MTKPIMIISGSIAGQSIEENARANAVLFYDLYCLFGPEHVVPVSGYYKGEYEQSYVVYIPGETDEEIQANIELVWDRAVYFNQESVLFIDTEKNAVITSTDTKEVLHKGPWTELPPGVDPDYDDYTEVFGVKYQIGRRIDYPELEGKIIDYVFPDGDITELKVQGANFLIGFTAKPVERGELLGYLCCLGPKGPGYTDYPGALEKHTKFFDTCIASTIAGTYYAEGYGYNTGLSCPFGT